MVTKLFAKLKMEGIFWLARRLPTCKDLAPWMSESLEQPLSRRRRIVLNLHLMICAWCRRYNEQLRALRVISQRFAAEDAPDTPLFSVTLSPEARERLKRALETNKKE